MEDNKVIKFNEKYFKTEVVASYVEVCFFGGFKYDEIYELASFIMGRDMNMCDLAKYRSEIMYELNKLYPNLERNIYMANGDLVVDEEIIESYKEAYKKIYGDYMLVRSKPILINENPKIKRLHFNKKNTNK